MKEQTEDRTCILAVLFLWAFMRARQKDAPFINRKYVVHRTDHLAMLQLNSIHLHNPSILFCSDPQNSITKGRVRIA